MPARDAQLNGPQGDLRAERIAIVLAKQGNEVERVEAYTNVTLKLDTRTVVGASNRDRASVAMERKPLRIRQPHRG